MSHARFHLFTYGTLGAKGAAAALLTGCERIGTGRVKGMLYDAGDYPALLLSREGQRIEGEIWRCPADLLSELDRYEGTEQGLFRRVGVRAEGVACWVYVAGPRLGTRLNPDARIHSWPINPR